MASKFLEKWRQGNWYQSLRRKRFFANPAYKYPDGNTVFQEDVPYSASARMDEAVPDTGSFLSLMNWS
jgi:hypothetical protein